MAAQALSKVTLKRLNSELLDLTRSPEASFVARPGEDDLLTWYFAFHCFPPDSPYHGGCYFGRLVLSPEYPLEAPSIFMTTPSGRFVTEEAVCVSMTAFHSQQWNPAWTIRSILVGFLSFWLDGDARSWGALSRSEEERRRLAQESWEANAKDPAFRRLFPELLAPSSGADGARTPPASPAADAGELVEAAVSMLREPLLGARVPGLGVEGLDDDLSRLAAHPLGVGSSARGACWSEAGAATEIAAAGEGGAAPLCQGSSGDEASLSICPEGGVPHMNERWSDAEERIAMQLALAESLEEAEEGAEQAREQGREQEGGEEEEEAFECWICRDRESPEPLIHPCACRGSMSGVHASCMDAWINSQARAAPDGGPPRCPVCQQSLTGNVVMPGMGSFMCHVARMFGRIGAQLGLLMGYIAAARRLRDKPCTGWPCVLEVAVGAAFCAVFLFKSLVLMASLPRFLPSPRPLRRLQVQDVRLLQLHLAEVIMALYVVLRLVPVAAAPLGAAALLPLGRCLCWRIPRASPRGLRFFLVFAPAAFCAVLLLRHIRPDILQSISLVLGVLMLCVWVLMLLAVVAVTIHPLNVGPHLLMAVVVFVVRVFAPKAIGPLTAILVVNSLLLALALGERVVRRSLRFRQNAIWALAFPLSAIAWAACNGRQHEPDGAKHSSERPEQAVLWVASTLWVVLVGLLSIAVNWDRCFTQHFRRWQHQHMAFRLDRVAAPQEPQP